MLSLKHFSRKCNVPFPHKKFIQQFNLSIEKRKFDFLRQLRILVQNQTKEAIQNNRYFNSEGKEVKLYSDLEQRAIQARNATILSLKNLVRTDLGSYRRYDRCADVEVVSQDCLVTALKLKYEEENLNPLMLNMANRSSMGGGFSHGCGAQEENIMRRTTMYLSFYNPFREDKNRKWSYPLPRSGGCYMPNVVVFRDSEMNGYRMLERPLEMSIVAVAALRRPSKIMLKKKEFSEYYSEILGDSQYAPDEEKVMLKIIETIFQIGLARGHDSLVLSALGCGAFLNPPFHCAVLFREVLEKYKYFFRKISFAIIEDHNSRHNRHGNYKPFVSVFKQNPVQ